ncbi:unnamed protein product [Rotaria sordida]|uniref:EF-hand domain-containing protein n=2 Tax=Rotaria sordida TaxID=392033 RepID=A0A819TY11_9BILA|nr:unnamed protein product [Rotaria sordida]
MAANVAFRQADLNHDGRLNLNEFRNFVGQHLDTGASSSWESASLGDDTGIAAGTSSFESAAWQSSAAAADLDTGYDESYAVGDSLAESTGSYESFSRSAGLADDADLAASGVAFDSSATAARQVHYATDAQGLFQDQNPHIIRRPAPGGVQTYTQHVKVRFLQPPPVPPPGPLIIKEVRPPQPPPLPPLRIRHRTQPHPPPPPLVLRERPPIPPPVIASQTVTRYLPVVPIPPRSVIIERLPPAPPRPRDIVIERWIQYGPQARRRTIVQRAPLPPPYPAPRNVVIQYDQAQVRVVRQFHRLGVVQANPALYVQTYGAHLLDGASLVAQARAAGVVENISAPGGIAVDQTASAYGEESFDAPLGLEVGTGLVAGDAEAVDAGLALGGRLSSSSSYAALTFSSEDVADWEGGLFVDDLGAGYGGSSLIASNISSNGTTRFDDAFHAGDTNYDGVFDQDEYCRFINRHVGEVNGQLSYETYN